MTDQRFHNLGVPGGITGFTGVSTAKDPGAKPALEALKEDWLNSKGPFSDGDDGRLDRIPDDLTTYLGAFRTPSLRCVSRRRAFMHNGVFRTLDSVLRFFKDGPVEKSYAGTPINYARNFSDQELEQMHAFLKSLNGSGPDPELLKPPALP
jgi:cytochrome c peroxidase